MERRFRNAFITLKIIIYASSQVSLMTCHKVKKKIEKNVSFELSLLLLESIWKTIFSIHRKPKLNDTRINLL